MPFQIRSIKELGHSQGWGREMGCRPTWRHAGQDLESTYSRVASLFTQEGDGVSGGEEWEKRSGRERWEEGERVGRKEGERMEVGGGEGGRGP